MNALKIIDLRKSFGKNILFNNLNLELNNGIYWLNAKNGMGKTTLLSLLAGVKQVDSGKIILNSINLTTEPIKYKNMMSYIPVAPEFYPTCRVTQFLEFILSVRKSATETMPLFKHFELEKYLSYQIKTLSFGTLKKLFLSTIDFDSLKLILLDEPFDGLDINAQNILTATLNQLDDTIILIASHQPSLMNDLNIKSEIHLA